MHDLINRGAVAPLGIALEGAFARHDHAVDLAQLAEVLEKRAVGQTDGEPPKILLQESPQDVAAQGSVSVTLVVQLPGKRRALLALLPLIDRARDEAFLDPGTLKELVDALELIAKLPVIRVAYDGRQSGPQRLGKGD
jgi:hypothetical protein